VLKSLRILQLTLEDRMTLKQQVGLATAALCVMIIVVLAAVGALISGRQVHDAASLRLSDLAFTFSDRLDRTITQRMGTLQLLTSLPELKKVWTGDPADMRGVLDRSRDYIPGASWLGYATADGIVRSAAGGLLEGQSVMDRPWFREGLAGPAYEDVHEARLLAPLLGPSPDGQPYRFVDIATPVKNERGNPIGVLGLHLSWGWIADIRTALVKSQTGVTGLDISIVAKDGTVLLAGARESQAMSPATLAGMARTPRGAFMEGAGRREELVGYSRIASIHQLGWFVVARQPAQAAFASAQTLVGTIIGIGVLVAIAGFVGAVIIAGRVSTPIRRLTEKADRIGRDSTDMLPRVRGSLEVVQLSSALRSLILRLGKAEKHTADVETRAADDARRLESDIAALRSIVDVDGLSGLLNRRGFMKFADDAMAQYRRYDRPFAVLMIDIDHFKRVNDTHGHAAGDAAIQAVAYAIESAIRPSDKAARFGGEEFVVLLREISLAAVEEAAERVRAAVAATPVEHNDVNLLVTVSVGVAIAEPRDRDIQDIIERADLALYSAKGAGRNRVAMASIAPPEVRLTA
jgi:diguanylate cyclase (GGDEF)-like protein